MVFQRVGRSQSTKHWKTFTSWSESAWEHYIEPSSILSDFGGLVVSMLASGTQVCGFKPGRSRQIFSGVKILSMPSFGREVKPFVPCCRFAARKRILFDYVEVGSQAKLVCHFSLKVPSFSNRGLRNWAARGSIEGSTLEQHDGGNQKARCTKGQYNKGLGAYGVTRPPTNLSSSILPWSWVTVGCMF
jgi:hypothetical protein